ncbi:MAG: sigma-54-dependent transcriptional regulator [Acidiferrobacterales bacterium]
MSAEIRESMPAKLPGERPIILLVEDDTNMRELVASVLAPLPAEVISAKSGQDAIALLEDTDVAVVVTDMRMRGLGGMEVLKFAKQHAPSTLVILITGYATVESAVEALKNGAYDYLRKPFEPEELRCTVERALEHCLLSRENLRLRAANRTQFNGGYGLIGHTTGMENVRRLIDAVTDYDCCVLITGESGCGKELVARQIHFQSRRKDNSFIAINCAAIPENIIESELFGYQKGAFTGADRAKPGMFETANGGTLFLDEINNAPLPLQAKLLRVLQDGSFYRLGDTVPRTTDARVLVASNRNLQELIGQGLFREDLYYRLNVVEIFVPPLRERKDDIPTLTNFFISQISAQLGKNVKGVTTSVLRAFMQHEWPGNVRELENIIKRMIILTETEVVDVDVLPPQLLKTPQGSGRALDYLVPQSLEEIEAYFIAKTLRETKGNRGLAAEILGIDKSTLWRKIKRYGLDE